MIVTFIFGIAMLLAGDWAIYGQSGWLHLKLGLLVLLVAYHIMCGKWLADFKYDRNTHDHIYYRWVNEIPVLFLISIIILAVVKPF
jgi:putative membrane protein